MMHEGQRRFVIMMTAVMRWEMMMIVIRMPLQLLTTPTAAAAAAAGKGDWSLDPVVDGEREGLDVTGQIDTLTQLLRRRRDPVTRQPDHRRDCVCVRVHVCPKER